MLAATLFVPSVSIFSGFKNYLKSNLKLPWILNFIWVIDISSWLSSVQFFPAALPVMEIKVARLSALDRFSQKMVVVFQQICILTVNKTTQNICYRLLY